LKTWKQGNLCVSDPLVPCCLLKNSSVNGYLHIRHKKCGCFLLFFLHS
jgi:hypothetical protein